MEPVKISSKDHFIITGGAGFIGSHLSKRLLAEGKKVTILTRNISTPKAQSLRTLGAKIISWDCSISQKLSNLQGISGAKVFLHLAADVSVASPSLHPTNVEGTERALELAKVLKIPYFVYASSIEAQGLGSDQEIPLPEEAPCHPVTDYGMSKVRAEEIVENWGKGNNIKCLILRIGNIYGPGSPWLLRPSLMALVGASSISPIWSDIKARKFQPLYIVDLVEGILRAVNQRLGGLYNISGEEAVFIKDYLHKLSCLTGLTERFGSLHEEALNVGQPTQKIDPEFSYFLVGEPDRHHRVYDSGKLRKEIGNYARWPLVRGLGATLQWYHAIGALPSLLTSLKGQQGGQLCMSH